MNKIDEKQFIWLVDTVAGEFELDYGKGETDVNFAARTGRLVVDSPHHTMIISITLDPIVSYVIEHNLDATPENEKFVLANIERALIERVLRFMKSDGYKEFDEEVCSNRTKQLISFRDYDNFKADQAYFIETVAQMKLHIDGWLGSVKEKDQQLAVSLDENAKDYVSIASQYL